MSDVHDLHCMHNQMKLKQNSFETSFSFISVVRTLLAHYDKNLIPETKFTFYNFSLGWEKINV